ncbi:hypothetical protein AiwAL_10340, partial [Acidiphilium sp. AL]|nr:hypothetical protein [Acidiphilium sp. AL]
QALLTMLYRSTDRRCRRGATMKNLDHSASFHLLENIAPLKSGIKHLVHSKLGVGDRAYFRDPVDEVRRRLGHVSMETTMVYLDHIAEHRHLMALALALALADLQGMYLDV